MMDTVLLGNDSYSCLTFCGGIYPQARKNGVINSWQEVGWSLTTALDTNHKYILENRNEDSGQATSSSEYHVGRAGHWIQIGGADA